jgi:hypothetical protein
MTYEEFLDFVRAKCMYETIYDDSDGRAILVIRMLDAYKFITQWQGLTDDELEEFENMKLGTHDLCLEIEAKLQGKNGG